MQAAYKDPSTAAREPEPGYRAAEPEYQEAVSQREAEYEPETVYEVAGAADHYQAGRVFVPDRKPLAVQIVSLGSSLMSSCANNTLPCFAEASG